MTTYEILLLVGAFAGVFALATLASAVLDRGSFRLFVALALITGGSFYVANVESENGLAFNDIPPALTKLVGIVSNG